MKYQRHFGGAQSLGDRDGQEDGFGFYQPEATVNTPERLLAVLADGMGGEAGGERASALAVDVFIQSFIDAVGAIPDRLQAALLETDRWMAKTVREDPTLKGMGCTLLAVVVMPEGIHWISVGDSLLYRIGPEAMERLNADHSLGAELDAQAEAGEISWEEARNAKGRHQLLSAVTGHTLERVDLREAPLPLQPGDRIILASDGLLTLSAKEIAAIVRRHSRSLSSEELAQFLVNAVVKKGTAGQDNTSVLVLIPRDAPGHGAEKTAFWKHRMGWLSLTLAASLGLLAYDLWQRGFIP
ncbi:MAG: serine/threonine-protein phosphatase [Magnetococcales bacterium]|nr:serine/threonine-protein phosphatase [Magnetococcales bacterium]